MTRLFRNTKMQLYTYNRSTAAYRVRIALNYKNIEHQLIPVNLLAGKHLDEDYKKHNQQARVPTLVDGDFEVGQSSAILEYLEEKFPEPALLPKDLQARAWIRYLSQIIISDMHPLNNVGVLNYLKGSGNFDATQIKSWYHHWLRLGFDTLENILSQHAHCKNFCWGNTPTFADLCLIPQVYNAYRFEFPMKNYPTLRRINEYCLTLPYFEKARPENQPDYSPNSIK